MAIGGARLVSGLSRDMVFHVVGLGSVSTVLYVLSWLCLECSCLVSHICVLTDLTVSLPGISCVETLTFLAESRPLHPLNRCLLTLNRFLWLLLFYRYNMS